MADNTIDTLSLEIKSSANSAVNSINRLAESLTKLSISLGKVDSSRFVALSIGIERMSTSVARFSQTVKTADFTRIANGLQRIAGLDVAGLNNATQAISTLSTNLTRLSTISFDSQGILNVSNSIAQLGRKTVTQAANNIPKLTTALSGLITELNALGTINFDVSSLANLVSSITRLGGKSATNAIPNIKALSIALKEMMQILSSAPSVSQNLIQMTQALAQLAANLRGVSSSGSGAAGGLLNVGSAASRTKKHVFSLAAAFGKFYATYWLVLRGFRMFKKAIDISSDLVEVQNVVDVTFGEMAQKVEDLSKVSIRDFGMSELTMKQISSRFQAMGVAMGFAQDEMSDMSIELTKLAADMASFYNVEQEMVAGKLSAIFTGQTRPLRDFGLDLTQATLQQWALAQGMEINIKEMSQAEKTLLRYRYVLANTTAAQGDFARTSGKLCAA